MWYEDYESIPCPYCGKTIDIEYPLNQKGADFESGFLGAKVNPIPCPNCGKKILAEPSLQWRIRKYKLEVKTNEFKG